MDKCKRLVVSSKAKHRAVAAIAVAAALLGEGMVAGRAWAQENEAQGFARFSLTAPSVSRGQSATLLSDGRWLIVGGSLERPSEQLRIATVSNGMPALQTLPVSLAFPRTGQTATVLPDGTVFIFGGKGPDGTMVTTAELFDPQTLTLLTLPDTGLFPRMLHSATLLTDGQVLIAGGLSAKGHAMRLSELWDPKTRKALPMVAALNTPRSEQQAALLANGKGLVWGGTDNDRKPLDNGELYDPHGGDFARVDWWNDELLPPPELANTSPQLQASLPTADATDVSVDARIAVRFSEPLRVTSVNDSTVTLVGPDGTVRGKVVAVEAGMVAFFTPAIELLPGATYTLFVNGASDNAGRSVPFTSFSFTTERFAAEGTNKPGSATASSPNTGGKAPNKTAANAPAPGAMSVFGSALAGLLQNSSDAASTGGLRGDEDNEDWIPHEENRHGRWRVLGLSGDPVLNAESLKSPMPQAARGSTAINGRILRLNGLPLSGVTVSCAGKSTVSDTDGVFLLSDLPSGAQQLKVDGTAVRSGGRHYTSHFIQIDLASGETVSMPNPIYLPRVDPATEISISSPADQELVLTHPAIPGLEVHIPKGAVLREYDGNIVHQLSITPIPVDRAPYPAPVAFSSYFTLQPGGSYVDGDPSNAIRIVYPNYQGLPPGTVVNFWNYDPTSKGWRIYGKGTVTANGKQVVPNPGVGFRQIMTFGFGVQSSTPAPPTGPSCPSCDKGDPVDISTGLFLHTVTDISLPDVMPIELTRTYHQNDPNFHEFGLGTTTSYAMYIEDVSGSSGNAPSVLTLVLANGTRIPFNLQSGNTLGNGVWMNTSPTEYQGAVLTVDSSNELFYITMRGGTKLTFGTHHSYNQLQSITDANGNTVSLTIPGSSLINAGGTASGAIQRITSPNGRYISLVYNHGNNTPCVDQNNASHTVITQATDNMGRSAYYIYDSACRLWKATDLDGRTETYNYDSLNRMTSVIDKRGNTMVSNDSFDADNRVTQQTLAGTDIWHYTYTLDSTNTYVANVTVKDPRDYISVYAFNPSGQATGIVKAQGQPEQQTYTISLDDSGRVEDVTDTYNRTTHYDYADPYGGPTGVTYLYNTTKAVTYQLGYDPVFHNLTSIKDPLGHTTQLTYTAQGSPYQLIDALGYTTTFGYGGNGQGLPTLITDPNQHQWQLGYLGGDLASISDPNSNTTRFFTDAVGRVRSVTDPMGRVEHLSYDNMDRLQQSTDPLGGVTQIGYDENGNTASAEDPRQYALGTKGKSHGYTPDTRNRVHFYTDPLGNTATYNYDGLSNLTSYIDRNQNTTTVKYDGLNRPKLITYQGGSTLTISWLDSANQIKLVDSANGTITLTYDNLFRITKDVGPQGEVDYAYDNANRRMSMTVKGQKVVKYSYYDNNWLKQVKQGTKAANLTYDNAGRPNVFTLPNSVKATYVFDDANRLKSITYKKGRAVLGDLSYDYDNASHVTSIGGSLSSLIQPPQTAASITYDAANRLTSWAGSQPNFDNNGNLTSGFGNSYSRNDRDQLTAVNGSPIAYDPLGRRVSYTANGTTHTTQYDGINPVLFDGTSFMLAGGGVDQYFAKIVGTKAVDLITDGLGSTRALTSTTGSTLTTTYQYDAYGNTSGSGSDSTPVQYTGRENDGNGGLYYYRNRYYMPQIGRFISQDPIGLTGGLNTYAYVEGNPISETDPKGEFGLVGAAIGGGIDLGIQLLSNGGRMTCVDWTSVGLSAVAGALTGGLADGAFALKGGSNAWGATRKWLAKDVWNLSKGQEVHHWLIEQGSTIGKMVPNSIKNQPWNLNPMASDAWHDFLHNLDPITRTALGAPGWAQGTGIGAAIATAGGAGGSNCGCN